MLKLHLFGAVSLRNGSGELLSGLLAHAKPTALIAILAHAAPDPVRRDRLLALLWPELDESRARNALSKALHLCRRALGDDALSVYGTETIGLTPGRWQCDLWTFREWLAHGDTDAAMAIFKKGEPLAGLHIPEAPEFDEWLDAVRGGCRTLALEVIGHAVPQAVESGDLSRAAELAGALCELNPFDEVALRLRLELLDRAGDRAGALHHYQQYRVRLLRELQVEPAPETEALVARVRGRIAAGAGCAPPSPVAVGVLSPPPGAVIRPRNPWRWLLAGAVAAVALLIAVPVFRAVSIRPTPVLLVSFQAQAKDSALELLSEVLSEHVTRSLVEMDLADAVNARARWYGSGMGFSASGGTVTGPPADLGRRLGVTLALHGQVSRAGDGVRVSLEVRHPDGVRILQTLEPVVGSPSEITPVLEQVSAQVQGWLAARSDPRTVAWATAASKPPTYEAYAAYIQALHHLSARDGVGAIRFLEEALGHDSGFVAAAGWLVRQYNTAVNRARAESLVARLQDRKGSLAPYDAILVDQLDGYLRGDRLAMLHASRRMLRFTTRSPDANWWHGYAAVATNHLVEGLEAFDRLERGAGWTLETRDGSLFWPMTAHHLLGDYTGELARIQRFRERNGEDHWVCAQELRVRLLLGDRDSLTRRINRCIGLAPLSDRNFPARIWWFLGRELQLHGEREEGGRLVVESVRLARGALTTDSSSQVLREQLGEALMQAGEWAEARAVWESIVPGMGGGRPPRIAGQAGVAAARAGDVAFAESALGLLASGSRMEFPWHRSRILASLGRRDEAMAELTRAVAMGMSMAELAHTDIGFELLRGYAPYEALVRPRLAPRGAVVGGER